MYKDSGSCYSHLPMILPYSPSCSAFSSLWRISPPLGEFLLPIPCILIGFSVTVPCFPLPQERAFDTVAAMIGPGDNHVTQARPIRVVLQIQTACAWEMSLPFLFCIGMCVRDYCKVFNLPYTAGLFLIENENNSQVEAEISRGEGQMESQRALSSSFQPLILDFFQTLLICLLDHVPFHFLIPGSLTL